MAATCALALPAVGGDSDIDVDDGQHEDTGLTQQLPGLQAVIPSGTDYLHNSDDLQAYWEQQRNRHEAGLGVPEAVSQDAEILTMQKYGKKHPHKKKEKVKVKVKKRKNAKDPSEESTDDDGKAAGPSGPAKGKDVKKEVKEEKKKPPPVASRSKAASAAVAATTAADPILINDDDVFGQQRQEKWVITPEVHIDATLLAKSKVLAKVCYKGQLKYVVIEHAEAHKYSVRVLTPPPSLEATGYRIQGLPRADILSCSTAEAQRLWAIVCSGPTRRREARTVQGDRTLRVLTYSPSSVRMDDLDRMMML